MVSLLLVFTTSPTKFTSAWQLHFTMDTFCSLNQSFSIDFILNTFWICFSVFTPFISPDMSHGNLFSVCTEIEKCEHRRSTGVSGTVLLGPNSPPYSGVTGLDFVWIVYFFLREDRNATSQAWCNRASLQRLIQTFIDEARYRFHHKALVSWLPRLSKLITLESEELLNTCASVTWYP